MPVRHLSFTTITISSAQYYYSLLCLPLFTDPHSLAQLQLSTIHPIITMMARDLSFSMVILCLLAGISIVYFQSIIFLWFPWIDSLNQHNHPRLTAIFKPTSLHSIHSHHHVGLNYSMNSYCQYFAAQYSLFLYCFTITHSLVLIEHY